MLAYVFWHRPAAGVPPAVYEAAQRSFHEALGAGSIEGLVTSTCHRIGSAPWLEGGGWYEDRYLLDGSWALDTLNRAAVSGRMEVPHGRAAALAGAMAAGLYHLLAGDGSVRGDWALWGDQVPEPAPAARGVALWRRQMVLGPAPGYCLLSAQRPPAGPSHTSRRFAIHPAAPGEDK